MRLTIPLTDQQARYLDQLRRTGLHGRTRTAVAREMLMKGLRLAATDGLLRLDHQEPAPLAEYTAPAHPVCHAGQDGECRWTPCPHLRDGEPVASGRHCPLDVEDPEE